MKSIILLLTTSIALFSVPVFAEDSILYTAWSSVIENDNVAGIFIARLNAECDRIEANSSWEDIDSLSNEGVEIVLSVMDPQNLENASEKELDEYVGSRFALIDEVKQYSPWISDENRRAFFEGAVTYMYEIMTAD